MVNTMKSALFFPERREKGLMHSHGKSGVGREHERLCMHPLSFSLLHFQDQMAVF
jgi:hypothetical protein